MSDTKINYVKAQSLLKQLKQQTEDLTTPKSNPEFPTSNLNFLDKITSIEQSYNQALQHHKHSLLSIEKQEAQKIRRLIDEDI